jgi:winged helix DNA-binding protein
VKIDIVRQRLRNQRLASSDLQRPADVVAWLGAVQSQDFPGAKWALGQRARGVTDADVNEAFDAGQILRTHILRPTWHFVAPADIRWILALTSPRVHARNGPYYRKFELDDRTFAKSRGVIERALEGGRQLTRPELGAALRRAGIEWDGVRLAHIVMHAELDGVICSGARRDKQFTYMLLAERAPQARTRDREDALAELTRRYFTSHGPATLRDYCWWSGLTKGDARAGVELLKNTLVEEVVDGLRYWYAPDAARVRRRAPRAFLLSNYDEYLVAHQDRGCVIESPRSMPKGPVEYPHQLLVDGKVRGCWKRTAGKQSAAADVRPYRPLDKSEAAAVDAIADRYSRFLGMPVTIRVERGRAASRRRSPRSGS